MDGSIRATGWSRRVVLACAVEEAGGRVADRTNHGVKLALRRLGEQLRVRTGQLIGSRRTSSPAAWVVVMVVLRCEVWFVRKRESWGG
jgi:hypothetical protein